MLMYVYIYFYISIYVYIYNIYIYIVVKYAVQISVGNYNQTFFFPGATTQLGVVFYSPLVCFSLFAYEVS